MSTPYRDNGGTSGVPASDYFSLPLQRSDLTDVSGLLDPADTESGLQLRAFLNEQPMIDTSSHFAASAIAIFQGSEGTYATTPMDREHHDQNDVSQNVLNQGIPSGQTSPVRTMTFQEIAALPVPHDTKPRVTLPATRTQRPLDVRLALNEPSHCGFVDDRVMIHQLIHAGIIPDPAPHHLWDEVDPLIAWYKEELITRLNVLLDGENRLRHRAKTLIRHMSTVRGEGRQHV
jgi:hypothetical protein